MPHRRLSTPQNCQDFVSGCNIMGIGGGGFPELGLNSLLDALDEGMTIEWIDVDDIADDAWTVSVYETGTIAPLTPETKAEIERFGMEPRLAGKEMEVALRIFADYAGVTVGAVVPVELGGDSTPFPLVAAARLGLPVVDGDYCGRAVPEEMQGTPYLYEKNIHPFVSVDRWGNVCILKDAANTYAVERIQKMLSVAAYGSCHLVDTLLPGKEMKEIVIRDTLTYSFELGAAVREARGRGEDPVQAIVHYTKGWLLFTGVVAHKEWEDREGYMWGTTWINGTGSFSGHVFCYWFKNENHISWLDDEPLVTTPDLIAVVDQNTGEGKINSNIEPGDYVAVVGIKGPEVFRSARGLSAAGPRHFGFEIDYVPIEERIAP